VGGVVTEVNSALNDAPETINASANETWIIKLAVEDKSAAGSLLSAAEYEKFVAEETGH
jgi:glycine cleavage system H protein